MKDSILAFSQSWSSARASSSGLAKSKKRGTRNSSSTDVDHPDKKYHKRRSSVRQTLQMVVRSRPIYVLLLFAVSLTLWRVFLTATPTPHATTATTADYFPQTATTGGGLRKRVEFLWQQRGNVVQGITAKVGTTITIERTQQLQAKFIAARRSQASLGDIYIILEAWLQEIDHQVRENVAGGIRWVRPNLLPPLPVAGHETARQEPQEYGHQPTTALRDVKREYMFAARNADPRGPMAWEAEWRQLQAAGVTGPPVDYRPVQKYTYPEKRLEPPTLGYPALKSMQELFQEWPQDEDYAGIYTETLLHFNYSDPVEREAARKFRDVELPFKLYDIPEVDHVTALWTDDYVSQQFDGHDRTQEELLVGFCQESTSNFCSFFVWWDSLTLGHPPNRNNDWTYQKWAEHARYADAAGLPFDKPHFYYQAGVDKSFIEQDPKAWTFISKDIPSFSSTTDNFFSFNAKEKHGIQCRFGERGVVAAQHQDPGRNMIAMFTGAKRYILSPPNQCSKFGIFPTRDSPLYRHSGLNFGHITRMDDPAMPEKERAWLEIASSSKSVETVLKQGEVLYLPSHWFHYIVSVQKSAQCNVRSGKNSKGRPEFGGEQDILDC